MYLLSAYKDNLDATLCACLCLFYCCFSVIQASGFSHDETKWSIACLSHCELENTLYKVISSIWGKHSKQHLSCRASACATAEPEEREVCVHRDSSTCRGIKTRLLQQRAIRTLSVFIKTQARLMSEHVNWLLHVTRFTPHAIPELDRLTWPASSEIIGCEWEIGAKAWKQISRMLLGDSRHQTRWYQTVLLAPNNLWLNFKRQWQKPAKKL